jgi:hypothetical protein
MGETTMWSRYRALFAAALVTAVIAAVPMVAGPAAAAGAATEPRGLWLYQDWNYKGKSRLFTDSWSNLADVIEWNWSDKTTSVRNADTVAWVLYDDRGFRDRSYCIRPGERVIDLQPNPWRFNDKTSSIKRLSTASCSGYVAFYSLS